MSPARSTINVFDLFGWIVALTGAQACDNFFKLRDHILWDRIRAPVLWLEYKILDSPRGFGDPVSMEPTVSVDGPNTLEKERKGNFVEEVDQKRWGIPFDVKLTPDAISSQLMQGGGEGSRGKKLAFLPRCVSSFLLSVGRSDAERLKETLSLDEGSSSSSQGGWLVFVDRVR